MLNKPGILVRSLVLISVIAVVGLAGCGGGGGGGGDSATDTGGPTVTVGAITLPSPFTYEGGNVTVGATASDASGVTEVKVVVTKLSDSTKTTIRLSVVSGSTFSGVFPAPRNIRSDGKAETYSVVVTATDSAGNTTSTTSATFDVPPLEAPPPPPPPPAS